MKKTAVILFNLGGPDSPAAVKPFLFNLFNDRAIIRLPALPRYFLAKLISSRREKKAQGIYALIGGRSPILEQTQAQAEALEKTLPENHKVFIAMRYWKPFAREVAKQVKDWGAEEIVLLPLYPQFSTTTSASSMEEWKKEAKKIGLNVPTKEVCCYPTNENFIAAMVELIKNALGSSLRWNDTRVLFSAHGLPEKIIAAGDPYQWQVEQTVAAMVKELGAVDYSICYQSRVGPLKWIGPSTEEEILRAAKDGKKILLVPVAFVSEHSETLVELDIEYRHLAEKAGVVQYVRVPTVQTHPLFIEGLKKLVLGASDAKILKNCNQSCREGLSGCHQQTNKNNARAAA